MSTQLEKIEDNLVKLTMPVEADVFESGLQKAYLKVRGRINMPGFRRGRAPRKIIEMQYGKEVFYEDALDFIFDEIYDKAITEHELEVVSPPSVDVNANEGGGATITVEVYTKPIATIEDYSGIEFTRPIRTLNPEEVDRKLQNEREQNARITIIEDRPAKEGDSVKIDFEGFINDVPFAGGEAQDFELILGSKSLIDTFEQQVEGKNLGDKFDVDVTFPDDYNEPSLASQRAIFKVFLKEIKERELPELDDDFAQEISEFDTLEEYRADIEDKLTKQLNSLIEQEIEGQIVEGLRGRISVNIPEPMVSTEADYLLRDFAQGLRQRGMALDHYLAFTGMDLEQMRSMYYVQARANIEGRLAIEAIITKEGIEYTDDEYNEEVARLCEELNIEQDKFIETMGNEAKNIQHTIKAKKAYQLALSQAIEKQPTPDEVFVEGGNDE